MRLLDLFFEKKEEKIIKSKVSESEKIETADDVFNKTPLIDYINTSITDLSYNGTEFFIQDDNKGRMKIEVPMSTQEVTDMIKQIANVTGKSFSYAEPLLDVSFGYYRLNAVHHSIAKNESTGATTFSIRHMSPKLLINERSTDFAPRQVFKLLKKIINANKSVIISGMTGSGKTEFQKYLVSLIKESSKIILIEDTYETYIKELFPKLDVSVWIGKKNEKGNSEIDNLIRVALRNNPDWIIVAEVRGNEASDLVDSIATGHPAITTLHSDSALESLSRLVMLAIKKQGIDQETLEKRLANGVKVSINLGKYYDEREKKYIRYIKEIAENDYKKGIKPKLIYSNIRDNDKMKSIITYNEISESLSKEIGLPITWYVGENDEER